MLHQGNLMFGSGAPSNGGLHFHPGATVTTTKTQQQSGRSLDEMLANVAAHNSMEEDGEIRPSQIDEFIEVRAALKKQMNEQLGFVPGP